MLGINISIIATLIASLFTPVSFHSVGAGGLLGTVIGLINYTQEYLIIWLIGAFAIVIITALSRYKLKAHPAFEIYVGLIIGIAVQALVFFFPMHGA
jgi:membrane-associated phospholipid phosphatase